MPPPLPPRPDTWIEFFCFLCFLFKVGHRWSWSTGNGFVQAKWKQPGATLDGERRELIGSDVQQLPENYVKYTWNIRQRLMDVEKTLNVNRKQTYTYILTFNIWFHAYVLFAKIGWRQSCFTFFELPGHLTTKATC